MASPATAQLCPLLTQVDRLEREVRLQLQNNPDSGPTPALESAIYRVVVHAGKLSEFVTYVTDFDRALNAYTFSILNIYSHQSRDGILTTASRLTASTHGGLRERMLAKSDAVCPELDEDRPLDGNTDADNASFSDVVSSMTRLEFTAPKMFMALTAVFLGSLLVWTGMRRARRLAAQSVRFQCDFKAHVFGDFGQQTLNLIDISATGAKMRLRPDTPLEGAIKIQIGRRKFPARIAWQNAHYAGIVFHKPLSRRFVELVSDGKVLRSRRP